MKRTILKSCLLNSFIFCFLQIDKIMPCKAPTAFLRLISLSLPCSSLLCLFSADALDPCMY